MNNLSDFLNDILKKTFLFFKQILIITLYLVINIFFVFILQKDLTSENLLTLNACNIFVNLFILVVFIFIFRKKIIPDYYDFKTNIKDYLKKNYKYWLMGLAIMVISNLIISSFIDIPSNEDLNRQLIVEMPVYSILSMIIIAPITEELMTRVILKDAFKNSYIYALFSGLIFGSLHLLSASTPAEIFYIIPYGALGYAFALMYSKSNNIWTNIFFHALHNSIAIVLIFIGA